MKTCQQMNLVMLVLCILGPAWVSTAFGQTASQAVSVSDLLQKYTQALDAIQSFTDTYQEESDFAYRMPGAALEGKKCTRGQNRSDGKRLFHLDYSWGDIRPSTLNLPESTPEYHLRLVADGKLYSSFGTSITTPGVKGSVSVNLQPAFGDKENITNSPYSGLYGYLGAEDRIDAVLRGAKPISVRAKTERVNGVACHVIDAHTKYGQYTVWLDPTHGYNAAKVTRKAIAGNHEKEWLMPRGDHAEASVIITRFEQVGDTWVPVEGDQHTVYTSGELFRNDRSHYKRANIVLNPDHDKLGSFANPLEHPANDPELKNGTSVSIIVPGSAGPVNRTWQDGKIIDDAGQIVNVSQLWASIKVSLLDTPLPALTDLCPDLSQVQSSNTPLLVCLCDIQQRSSRNSLLRLSQEARGLLAKGLMIVVIQVSPLSEANHAWLRIQNIDLPIYTVEGDFEAKQAAWTVKGLPWLILTDKDHKVVGEGLSVEEVVK